jgi:hypothetical protein
VQRSLAYLRWRAYSASAMLVAMLGPAWPAAAQDAIRADGPARLEQLRTTFASRRGGVLGLMGYSVIPDGSANALQVDRSSQGGSNDEGDPTLTLSQFGFGFTWGESFPLFTEIYFSYARYDPRAVFTRESARVTPFRWNNFTGTLGIGYDIRLSETLWLRPIVNVAAGYAASDVGLFASFIEYRRNVDLSLLTDAEVQAWGVGGALTLAHYDYRPEREIDVELRYTQIHLETFGNTVPAARGQSTAQALGLWGRYRWPSGWEMFGRPLRWVLDGNATAYLGDQRDAIGFSWALKVGGGIEFDTGRWELGAMGINLNRVRLIGRYFYADDNITGYSFGIGMSF